MVCAGVMRKWSATRAISTRLIHTNPGPPVQQLPHWVHVKRRPWAYQGSFSEVGSTSSFISEEHTGDACGGSTRSAGIALRFLKIERRAPRRCHIRLSPLGGIDSDI